MPTYNAQEFLNDALFSIKNQNNVEFELIVIDNNSSDRTIEIVERYNDIDITIIKQKDSGAADALNKGFALAKGEVLCWLNSDDVYVNSNVLSIVISEFCDLSIDFVYGHSFTIDRNGMITKTLYSSSLTFADYLSGANLFTGSLFFRKNVWNSFGGFNIKNKVYFEFELFDYLFQYKQSKCINYFLAALRVHSNTITSKFALTSISELQNIRNNNNYDNKFSIIRRITSYFQDGNLIRVFINKYFDRYRGANWSDFFYDHNVS